MSEMMMRKGLCPKCREVLEVPAHLKQFSCMYCGTRLSAEHLLQEEEGPQVNGSEAQAAADYYYAHALEVLTNHRGIDKQLSKAGYGPAMDALSAANEKTFRQLNIAWLAGAIDLSDAVSFFLDGISEEWEKNASWKPGQQKQYLHDTDKFTLAVFVVPMIKKLGLPCSDPFCQELHSQWMARWPKSQWQIGDYDTINAGFKKKFLGMCFITTAVCQNSHKADDCAELTAFRSFRDGYLRSCEDGPALIEAYYHTAPAIVWEIEKCADSAARYEAIRKTWLEPCFADLQEGRLASCKERYTDMVQSLQKEYLS